MSAAFRSTKQHCEHASFIGSKHSSGNLPADVVCAEDDQYVAVGYVVTKQGTFELSNFSVMLSCLLLIVIRNK